LAGRHWGKLFSNSLEHLLSAPTMARHSSNGRTRKIEKPERKVTKVYWKKTLMKCEEGVKGTLKSTLVLFKKSLLKIGGGGGGYIHEQEQSVEVTGVGFEGGAPLSNALSKKGELGS